MSVIFQDGIKTL